MVVLHANQFVDAAGHIVASGELLADRVSNYLRAGKSVEIDFSQMKGLSSSYFNVLLARVIPVVGADHVEERLRVRFESEAQAMVYRRSLASVKSAVA